MLVYFLLGAALGAATGVPIGPVGTAVIDAAYRHPLRRAIGVGVGGGTGDMLCAALGILGIGPLLAASPEAPPVLFAVSGVALVAFGAVRLRSPAAARETSPTCQHSDRVKPPGQHARTGFAAGLGLVLANPGSLVTWVVIVGSVMGSATTPQALASIVGVGIGSAAWYAVLAHIARRATRALGDRMLWVTKVAGALLMVYGLFSLARGAQYWLG